MTVAFEYGDNRQTVFLKVCEFGFEKPLIRDFFHCAHLLLRNNTLSCRSMSGSGDMASSTGGLSLSTASVRHSAAAPAPQEDILPCQKFLALTPSVSEPLRVGHSGVLSESESLQVKHHAEYEYLIPALSMALNSVIAAQETWQRETDKLQRHQVVGATDKDPLVNASAADGASPSVLFPTLGAATRVSSDKASNGDAERMSLIYFETISVPCLSVDDYVRRIAEHTYVSPSTLLVACLYLDRLLTRKRSLVLTLKNTFKLFATAVRLASKVMDTRTLSNKCFAVVGGFGNSELNILEAHFLAQLDLDLYVSASEFSEYAATCPPRRRTSRATGPRRTRRTSRGQSPNPNPGDVREAAGRPRAAKQ